MTLRLNWKRVIEQVVSGYFLYFLAVLVTEGLRREARIILVKFRYDRLDYKKNNKKKYVQRKDGLGGKC